MGETSKDLSWTLFMAQCVQSLQLMWQSTASLSGGYFTPIECVRELLRRLRVCLAYSWSCLEFDHGSRETSFFTLWAASRQIKSDNDSVCPDVDTVLCMCVCVVEWRHVPNHAEFSFEPRFLPGFSAVLLGWKLPCLHLPSLTYK